MTNLQPSKKVTDELMIHNCPSTVQTNEPPNQIGTIGETLTALVRAWQLAEQNDRPAGDPSIWDQARAEAAKQWRRDQ